RRRGLRPSPSALALRRPEPDDDDVLPVLLAQRVELSDEAHADAEVLLLAGEGHLEPGAFRQIDLAHAIAFHVLDPHRAEERHVDERIAVERAARRHLRLDGAARQALGAHQALREEVLAAVLAARAQHFGRRAGIVGNGEVPGFDRNAGTDVGHGGRGEAHEAGGGSPRRRLARAPCPRYPASAWPTSPSTTPSTRATTTGPTPGCGAAMPISTFSSPGRRAVRCSRSAAGPVACCCRSRAPDSSAWGSTAR